MLSSGHPQSGLTLIELMIAITIVSILLFLALPNMSTWLNNSQIRTTGETLLVGINVARNEAMRRNAVVRFQLATSLDSGCALSASGKNWVISLADPAGACDADPSDTVAPQIIQKKSSAEGSQFAEVAATGSTTLYFSGLGRLTNPLGVPNISEINISNPIGGICRHVDPANGTMRCLRITISPGGQIKMCDPAVTDNTDPRFC